MAQGSKSRVVIWTIVGILVVVAVVMLLTRPKTATGGIKTDPVKFATQMEGRLGRFESKAAQAGLTPDVMQKITDEIGKTRAALQEMQGMAGKPEAEIDVKKTAAQDGFDAARKLYKEATGKDAGGDSGGTGGN